MISRLPGIVITTLRCLLAFTAAGRLLGTVRVMISGALLLILGAAGGAVGAPGRDLRNLPASQQVVAVTLCRGQYDVALKDGTHAQFAEYSLVFKMDTSEFGPPAAALVVSSRSPWRATIVLPNPQALMEVLYRRC
jgi:hypothetical protein